MELYFLRHGIAENVGPAGTGDAGRALTKDGIVKMQVAARALHKFGLHIDLLLSSPLTRAHETAEIVAQQLGLKAQIANELSPGCNVPRLFELLGEHRAAGRVMLVGHEPHLSEMVSVLTGGSRILFKRGALARVDVDILKDGQGTLVWLLQPRVLRTA